MLAASCSSQRPTRTSVATLVASAHTAAAPSSCSASPSPPRVLALAPDRPAPSERFIEVNGITDATAIASDIHHACALIDHGKVACWGDNNESGQLGDGTTTARDQVVVVPGLSAVRSIAVGPEYTCAIRSDDRLACWGSCPWGDAASFRPTALPSTRAVRAFASEASYGCVLRVDGAVFCFGNAMGAGSNGVIPGVHDVDAISVGAFGACALEHAHPNPRLRLSEPRQSRIVCWGAGSIEAWEPSGPGDPGPSPSLLLPTELGGAGDALAVDITHGSSDFEQPCLVRRNGRLACWDTGTTLLPLGREGTPQDVGLDHVVATRGHTVLRSTGEMFAIATDDAGGFGARRLLPEVRDVVAIASRCAIRSTGRVICWQRD